mmetsp:Transcript_301/g.821  ORF Transcript_301/g.821 Transcript_301/m.821 type:complete len:207 (+) Transcript_301:1775-2395(+)
MTIGQLHQLLTSSGGPKPGGFPFRGTRKFFNRTVATLAQGVITSNEHRHQPEKELYSLLLLHLPVKRCFLIPLGSQVAVPKSRTLGPVQGLRIVPGSPVSRTGGFPFQKQLRRKQKRRTRNSIIDLFQERRVWCSQFRCAPARLRFTLPCDKVHDPIQNATVKHRPVGYRLGFPHFPNDIDQQFGVLELPYGYFFFGFVLHMSPQW